MSGGRIRTLRAKVPLLVLPLFIAGCEPADPLDGFSPFATMGCGGFYLALAADPTTSASDRRYYEALADGLVTATTNFSAASRREVTVEMERWRDDWQREAQSDWAQTPEGRAENANFRRECADVTASLPETRGIQRGA